MSWTTASDDLRIRLNDGPTDKLRAFKRVFGEINGTNRLFKTYETRRVTDFSSEPDASNLGVYVDGQKTLAASIESDDVSSGYVTLVTAPSAGAVVEASYFVQNFTDAEISVFLKFSTNWLALGDDPSGIPSGLRPAAIEWAAGDAYQRLALRMAEPTSDTYRLEDMPSADRAALISQYQKLAQDAKALADKWQKDFYSKHGAREAALFGVYSPKIVDVAPRR